MLILPTPRLIREFANLRDPLPEILGEIGECYERNFGSLMHWDDDNECWRGGLCVSSIYRTPAEDRALGASGIHCSRPHRAIDIPMSWDMVAKIARVINRRWVL